MPISAQLLIWSTQMSLGETNVQTRHHSLFHLFNNNKRVTCCLISTNSEMRPEKKRGKEEMGWSDASHRMVAAKWFFPRGLGVSESSRQSVPVGLPWPVGPISISMERRRCSSNDARLDGSRQRPTKNGQVLVPASERLAELLGKSHFSCRLLWPSLITQSETEAKHCRPASRPCPTRCCPLICWLYSTLFVGLAAAINQLASRPLHSARIGLLAHHLTPVKLSRLTPSVHC